VRLEGAGTATGVKVAGIAATGANAVINNTTDLSFVVADATGVATVALTLTSATTGQTAIVGVSGDGVGVDDITITVTFTDAAAALTTVPATATTSFVAVSSSQTITASIADQYANPVVGGSVLLTNTSAPVLVTLATAVSVNVSNTGTATLTAPIAATVGNYVYTVQARDANGGNVGTLSTITYTATTDGAPGSVTLTSGGSEAALGSFTVWTSTNGTVPLAAAAGAPIQAVNQTADASLSTDTAAQALAKVGDHVVITVKVSNAAGTGIDNVKVGVVGSAGVFLATTQPANDGTTKLSAMTSTSATSTGGGVATIHAVATKVGTNTVTFTVGSKTATATFISKQGLAVRSIARTVTLGSATVAVTGGAIAQSVATVKDAFGNPVAGVSLTGTISGVAGRFAGGARSFAASTGADGTVTFEITGNVTESGAGTLTVAGTDAAANITTADFLTGDLSGNLSTLGILQSSSTTATLAVTAGVADSSSAQIKTDVATANSAVKNLATQVTVLQASVATLIDSLTTQIASLMKSVSALTKAVAKLQAKK
jgi:adhesin/invasin